MDRLCGDHSDGVGAVTEDFDKTVAKIGRDRAIGFFAPRLIGLAIVFVVLMMSCAATPAHAAPKVRIPEASAIYRIKIEREAQREFGLSAPIARLAAQIHQESAWKPWAESPYAQGLTQFTPATAKWVPEICPSLDGVDPWNTNWAIEAQVCYMHWLYRRVLPFKGGGQLQECSKWAFALRAYNGGEGWLQRERAQTRTRGDDPNDWLRVERYRSRGAAFHKENIGYPRRILLTLEPAYVAAGWPGNKDCKR